MMNGPQLQIDALHAAKCALHDALPKKMRGGHAATSAEMAETVARLARPGDVIAVKGSFGSRMAEIVKRLLAGQPAVDAVKG